MDHVDKPKTLVFGLGWSAVAFAVVALVLSLTALRAIGSVVKQIAFAWILMLILAPAVRFLSRRLRVPETLAILCAMALAVLVFFEAGVFINSLVSSFVPRYGDYARKLQELLGHFYALLPDKAVSMLKGIHWQESLSAGVLSMSGMVISASSTTAIVMIITAFLLLERRDFSLKVTEAFEDHDRLAGVLSSISAQVSRYLILQCLISAVTGVCVWLALWAIGIDFPATWGFLAFVLNFIPTIGSILASIPPLIIALVQYAPDTYVPFFLALTAILTIQMVIGNVVSPRVMGDQLNLSPVVILVSLLFWNWLWGPAGALLSTPIMAAVKIICDNIEPLRPVGILLGSGRPFRKGRQ